MPLSNSLQGHEVDFNNVCYLVSFLLSSPVHPAHLRDGHEDAREGTTPPLHARLSTRTICCQNTHTHTHTHICTHTHTHSYAFLHSITDPWPPPPPPPPPDLLCTCTATEDALFRWVSVSLRREGRISWERLRFLWIKQMTEWMNVMNWKATEATSPFSLSGLFLMS